MSFGIFDKNKYAKKYKQYKGIIRYHKPVFRIQCDICGEEILVSEQELDNHIDRQKFYYHEIIQNYDKLPEVDYICNQCLNQIINFNVNFKKRYNFELDQLKNAEDYDYN